MVRTNKNQYNKTNRRELRPGGSSLYAGGENLYFCGKRTDGWREKETLRKITASYAETAKRMESVFFIMQPSFLSSFSGGMCITIFQYTQVAGKVKGEMGT